jgi:hypothetical protein
METTTNETLEIYIDYDRLKATDLANCLINLSDIASKIAEDYFSRFSGYEGEDLPTLDINSIDTGNSIKFTLKEGWKPKIKTGIDGDIIVEVPKNLGLPIVIGYLLISIANGYQEFRSKQLDNQLKELEIKLKQTELAKAISVNHDERQDIYKLVTSYINNKVPEVKPIFLDTIRSVLSNPDITQFKVNNIEIKNAGEQ